MFDLCLILQHYFSMLSNWVLPVLFSLVANVSIDVSWMICLSSFSMFHIPNKFIKPTGL